MVAPTAAGSVPSIASDVPLIDDAYRIATADLLRSVSPYRGGVLEAEAPVFMAGEWYATPWTRDAAINTWNGGGLLYPSVARDTLLSTLTRRDGRLFIDGEYWDAIIWSIGAWALHLLLGDRDFLRQAFEATSNTLALLESTEFDSALHLFRGPAVYGDGVAAYPDAYTRTEDAGSSIKRWAAVNPTHRAPYGEGLPMHALSTNCLYVEAYRVAALMAGELGEAPDPGWSGRAAAIRAAINERFWIADAGRYRYLVDPLGDCDAEEGLGSAFAMLFGIADPGRADLVLRNAHMTPAGVPCVWPPFERYRVGDHVGRHSGTVWPPIQAFWAEAAARAGHVERFQHELLALAASAVRDGQFFELYHPVTAAPYGGLQERHNIGITRWEAMPHQTWSATAFIRMVLMILVGLRWDVTGVEIVPSLPPAVRDVTVRGLTYRSATLDIHVRAGEVPAGAIEIDGEVADRAFIAAPSTGHHSIEIVVPAAPGRS